MRKIISDGRERRDIEEDEAPAGSGAMKLRKMHFLARPSLASAVKPFCLPGELGSGAIQCNSGRLNEMQVLTNAEYIIRKNKYGGAQLRSGTLIIDIDYLTIVQRLIHYTQAGV